MNVRVRVASAGNFSLKCEGDYHIDTIGGKTIYTPKHEKCIAVVDNIRIGIDFHWQQDVTMRLPGVIEVEERLDGLFDIYNVLPVDSYLESVISSEMSAEAPIEFLKAHAIVSRSWVVGKILHRHNESSVGKIESTQEIRTWEDTADHDGFDVCADDHCQRYQGVARVNEAVRRAVRETSDVVLKDQASEVIDARFSKCCGGRTELFSSCWQDENKDYLVGKDDPYCNPLRMPPAQLAKILDTVLMKYDRRTENYYDWEETVFGSEIVERLYQRHGIDIRRIIEITTEEQGSSGRITKLKLEGEKGTFYVGKELAIRRLLSDKCLYSSWFEVEKVGEDEFRLHGRGWGHGVGLCQIGAAVMASEGATCEDILEFYYPTTKLEKI